MDVEPDDARRPVAARRNTPALERASKGRLVIFERADGRWGWRLSSENGRIIAVDGGEGFQTAKHADLEARRVLCGDYVDVDADRQRMPE